MRRFLRVSSVYIKWSFGFCSINNKNPLPFQQNMSIKPEISKDDIDAIKDIFYKESMKQNQSEQNLEIEPEEILKDREQIISFKLLNRQDVNSILKLYLDEVEKQNIEKLPKFTPNELSLFAYFISCSRTNLNFQEQITKNLPYYNSIINQCIEQIEFLGSPQTNAFLWALGIYHFETNQLNLTEPQKFLILQKLDKILEEIPYESLSSLAFSLLHIFGQNSQQASPILFKIISLINKNLSNYQTSQLISLILALPANSITASNNLFKDLKKRFEEEQDLSGDDFVTVILELLRILNGEEHATFVELIQSLEQSIKAKGREIISPSVAIQLLSTIPKHEIADLLLQSINCQIKNLNISDFVNLYLTLPKLKVNFEKTLENLKILPQKSNIFKFTDFTLEERVNILFAISQLRIDQKEYVIQWVKSVENDIKIMKKADLMKLATNFVIYVRQFKYFYVEIHRVCATRINQFSRDELQQLQKVFIRVKILFPDSPFFKI